MLGFSKQFTSKGKSSLLKAAQDLKPTSHVGKEFKNQEDSKQTNNKKSFYSKLFLGVGILGLASSCALLYFGYTIMTFVMLFVGGGAMIGIPLSRHYIDPNASASAESTQPQEEAQSPNLDKKLTDILVGDKPKVLPSESDKTSDKSLDFIFGEFHSASEDEFSDECPPAKPSDYDGVFIFDELEEAVDHVRKRKL